MQKSKIVPNVRKIKKLLFQTISLTQLQIKFENRIENFNWCILNKI